MARLHALLDHKFEPGDLYYSLVDQKWFRSENGFSRKRPNGLHHAVLTCGELAMLNIFPPDEMLREPATVETLAEKVQHLENRLNALTQSLDILKSK